MLTRLNTQYKATCIMHKERERCSDLDQELVATQLLCRKKKARVGLAEDVLHWGKSRQFQHQGMCCTRWNWQLQHQRNVLHQMELAASTPKKTCCTREELAASTP